MSSVEKVLKAVVQEINRLNSNLETRSPYIQIPTEILMEEDVFNSEDFLPKYSQSKTPVEFIVGKQGQLGILEYEEDGKKIAEIWLNKYEVSLLRILLRHKL